MLKTRILTAIVLVPLAWLAIFRLSPEVFAIAAALLLTLGAWEFSRLGGLENAVARLAYTALQAAVFTLLITSRDAWVSDPTTTFQWAVGAWLLMFIPLWTFGGEAAVTPVYRIRALASGLAAVTTGWLALAFLRGEPGGSWWLVVLLLTIWSADIAAYFCGRAFGRRKLAPAISPGKTWAGFWGGLTAAALVPLLAVNLIPDLSGGAMALVLMGAVTAVVSVGGDLFISLHKRTVGLKDTGKIFPGHGGVLDRLDSLIAGAPFFVLVKLLAGL